MLSLVTHMLNVSIVRDRMACSDVLIELGMRYRGSLTFKYTKESAVALETLKREQLQSWGSLTELYLDKMCNYMDMTNFEGSECLKLMEYSSLNMVCRLWLFSPPKASLTELMASNNMNRLMKHLVHIAMEA